MPDVLSLVLGIIVVVGGAGWVGFRGYQVVRPKLPESELPATGQRVLEALWACAPGPEVTVEVGRRLWSDLGLSSAEATHVVRYLGGRGLVEWRDLLAVLLWSPAPAKLALTSKARDQMLVESRAITVYGPTVFGGHQVNSGTFNISADGASAALNELLLDLIDVRQRFDGEHDARMEQAIQHFDGALRKGTLRSPEVGGSLRWLVEFGSATGANILGGGIVAAASALLVALGMMP